MTFEQALPLILKSEGGYVNRADDRGGETNYGITISTARRYGYNGSMKSIPMSEVARIYRKLWDAWKIDTYPAWLRYPMFDMTVNHGGGNAIGILATAVGLPFSQKWTDEIDRRLLNLTADRLYDARVAFYKAIVKNDPSQQGNLKGWMNRAKEVADNVLGFLKENPGLAIIPVVVIGLAIFFLIKDD